MKSIKSLALLVLLTFCFTLTTFAKGKSKTEIRVNYVLQNIGVSNDAKGKLKPLLYGYLKEIKDASKEYDDLKDSKKDKAKSGKLTDAEAEALLNAKWAADAKELSVKKSYAKKFKAIMSSAKVWKCFDLLNDKMSKITGKDKD